MASRFIDGEGTMASFKLNPNNSRFYEREVPEVNQLVMVKVTRVAETSAYVQLLEYADIEGMIIFSEISTRRIRSMLKEIRVGQFAVCLVLRVEKEKGYIDLSRRRVNAEERSAYLQTYAKSKLVHSTLRQLCEKHEISMPNLCKQISWPLYQKHGHAIDAFKAFINDNDISIFADLQIEEKVKTQMYEIIKKKLTPQAIKLKAKVEVRCEERAGIEAVKAALMAGLNAEEHKAAQVANGTGGPNDPVSNMGLIQIKVVAPPHYEVITQSVGKESGVKAINEALDRIKAKIEEYGGKFDVKSKPEILGEGEEEIIDKDVASDAEAESDSEEEDQDETMGNFNPEM